jgi:hypothetical protein
MVTLVRTSVPLVRPVRTRSVLCWRREPGAPSDDLGVAWVIESDGAIRPINDGDPISSAEAKRLARVGEHMLDAEPLV